MSVGPLPLDPEMLAEPPALAFARAADYAECRRLHREYGTTYYHATRFFNRSTRQRVHALYGFVRVPDEWVDNPGDVSTCGQIRLLQDYRSQLLRGLDGVCPDHPVLRAFCDVVRETHMPLEEPLCFLDAMEQDLTVSRYETYEQLVGYMRGSAAAVGLMMCAVVNARPDPAIKLGACALGNAMQLTNFLRDVGEDARRGRIYLPLEDLEHFGVREDDILQSRSSTAFVSLMKFEMARARAMYEEADVAIPLLPRAAQRPVRLARILYSRILDRIEENGYDVFSQRARTTKMEKLGVAMQVILRG